MKQEIINQLNQLAKENEPFLFVINYEGTEAYIRKLSEIDPAACLYDFEGVSNAGTMASQPLPSSILWDVEAPLYEDYEKSFEVVERHIKAGDTHLVNLTSPVAVRCNLSLEEIFLHTQGKYKLMLKNGDQGFVCFSPETFVRINEGRIYSYPMKGTIDATLPNAEQIIMADEKEAAEHVSVVELISEDLSRVSSDVRVVAIAMWIVFIPIREISFRPVARSAVSCLPTTLAVWARSSTPSCQQDPSRVLPRQRPWRSSARQSTTTGATIRASWASTTVATLIRA